MKWKKGVDKRVKPETAYWMGRVEEEWKQWFHSQILTCTSAYREIAVGAHGRGEAFDLRRPPPPIGTPRLNKEDMVRREIDFCRHIQKKWGRYLGVVLEPEWGKGKGYTGPHYHFQLKKPALWK